MNRIAFGGLLAAALLKLSLAAADDVPAGPLVLPVWPGEVAGDFGSIGPERIREPDEAPTPDATWITNVTKPTITVFQPSKAKHTGLAMLICPGGGYWNLAWDREGEEVAAWLNKLGVTGVVLKYRVPRRPGQPERLPAPGPRLDAQRAIRLVRSKAKEWRLDPQRIGIIGFSAGGHLAVSAATYFDRRGYERVDQIDEISCRPNFAVAVYPGYLVPEDEDTDQLAPYIRIPERTPPMFFVHASDDPESGPEHSLAMYLALKRAGVRAELHIYSEGGHGFGVRSSSLPCSTWTDRCGAWLRSEGFLVDAAAVPQYTIQRTSGAINVDGQLDEPDWRAVRSVGDFQFPWWIAGEKEQTEAKILWDDRNLYLSYRCRDAHIWAEHTQRDSPVYRDDCVEVFTAPNPRQPNNYFNIEMNAGGAFLDQHHPEGPGVPLKKEWNAKGVQVAVAVNGTLNDDTDVDREWVLEAAIPLSNFASVADHIPPHDGDIWHLNLNRLGGKTNAQHSQWSSSRTARPSFHVPRGFGRVKFSSE